MLKHIVILTQTLYPRNSMTSHCREVISMAGLVGEGLPLLQGWLLRTNKLRFNKGNTCVFLLVSLGIRYLSG